MSHTLGPWKCVPNFEGGIDVITSHRISWDGERFPGKLIAEVETEGIRDPNANARLIAKAPEMYTALCQTVKALKATEDYMRYQELDTLHLDSIINGIEDMLDSIDYCV